MTALDDQILIPYRPAREERFQYPACPGRATSLRRATPRIVIETDTVAALYTHLATGSWSAVIAHT